MKRVLRQEASMFTSKRQRQQQRETKGFVAYEQLGKKTIGFQQR